jgi:putative lipoic acid-binding regulatory protein
MDQDWLKSFQTKLDQHHSWPSVYIFKFIVPKGKEEELKGLFPLHTPAEKASTQGNYISLTFQMMMHSSEAVIEIYVRAEAVEGLIAL